MHIDDIQRGLQLASCDALILQRIARAYNASHGAAPTVAELAAAYADIGDAVVQCVHEARRQKA